MKKLLAFIFIAVPLHALSPEDMAQQKAAEHQKKMAEFTAAQEKAGAMIAKFVNNSDEKLRIKAQTQGGCGVYDFTLSPGGSDKLFLKEGKKSCCITDFQIYRQGRVNFQIYTSKDKLPGNAKSLICGKTITINSTWGGTSYNESGADVTW